MITKDQQARLIELVDSHMAEVVATAEVQSAWKILRGELRRTRRQSENVLPAVADAAQHAALARDHATKALEAMGGVTFGHDSTPPPPRRDDE